VTDPTALPPVPPASPVDPAAAPLYLTMDGELRVGDVLAALEAGAADEDRPLRDRVTDALLAEGLPAELDEDGDVGLVLDDQMLFVRCVDSQPPLARVFGQWVLDGTSAGELTWLRAANAVTGAVNLVKASVHGDRLVVAIDLVVAPGLPLGSVLSAAFQAVLDGARTFTETVEQLNGQAAGGYWDTLA
jgi:hypothetical protein